MQPGQDVLPSLLRASARSWRLSDGRGALSRGTASGAATRRAHVLLSAPAVGPHAAWPAVSLLRFDDRARLGDGQVLELTPAFILVHRTTGAPTLTARAGSLASCESFAETPWPRWRFRGEGWLLEREYRLIEDHPRCSPRGGCWRAGRFTSTWRRCSWRARSRACRRRHRSSAAR
jgi:hypothetical protein